MKTFTDDTPIAMLTVGQLKQILSIDRTLGKPASVRTPENEVLTVEGVTRLTGYSTATVYKLTCERKIPFHKPEHGGRRLFFNREERSTAVVASFSTGKRFSNGCNAIHPQPSNNIATNMSNK